MTTDTPIYDALVAEQGEPVRGGDAERRAALPGLLLPDLLDESA